jgi:hypothetical protein
VAGGIIGRMPGHVGPGALRMSIQVGTALPVSPYAGVAASKRRAGLYDAGKIDLSELFMLQTAGMPLGKAGPNGEFLALSEAEKASFNAQPVNYIQTFKDGIDHLEQTGYANDPKSGHARMKHVLEVLQRAHAQKGRRAILGAPGQPGNPLDAP